MSTSPSSIPLSVLDLTPVVSGSDTAEAVRRTLDLAQQTEAAGYRRYWVAEHHLNPGVAGVAPVLAIALVAQATARIRVGSGAVLAGHHTALELVEQFGLLDALHPDRLDLGLGRSANRGAQQPTAPPAPVPAAALNGLPLPPPPAGLAAQFASPRFRAQQTLLGAGGGSQSYPDQINDLLALVEGTHHQDGVELHALPGEGAGFEVWILGSSGGESAQLAGKLGLPFGANYHVAPHRVLEAVESYREAFVASERLAAPQVIVSADVVVADTDEEARRQAAGYRHWVHSIRSGTGAIPYPSPAEAAELPWTSEQQDLVADRLATQFVGSPQRVVEGLQQLAEATAADELLITTITHDHRARVRSYQLLAEAWTVDGHHPNHRRTT